MELAHARFVADTVIAKLAPYCDRLCVAGSVRRGKAECRDLEVVCIPKQTPQNNMFQERIGWMRERAFCNTVNQWKKVKGEPTGKYTQRILPGGETLDLFIATPENWGLILVVRTGSVDYIKKIASRWVSFGYHGVDGMLHDGYHSIPIREEKELFDILGLPFVEPKDRI